MNYRPTHGLAESLISHKTSCELLSGTLMNYCKTCIESCNVMIYKVFHTLMNYRNSEYSRMSCDRCKAQSDITRLR